jgi:hypothetical protein
LNLKDLESLDLHSDERTWQPQFVQNLVVFHWHTETHAAGEKVGSPGHLGASQKPAEPRSSGTTFLCLRRNNYIILYGKPVSKFGFWPSHTVKFDKEMIANLPAAELGITRGEFLCSEQIAKRPAAELGIAHGNSPGRNFRSARP